MEGRSNNTYAVDLKHKIIVVCINIGCEKLQKYLQKLCQMCSILSYTLEFKENTVEIVLWIFFSIMFLAFKTKFVSLHDLCLYNAVLRCICKIFFIIATIFIMLKIPSPVCVCFLFFFYMKQLKNWYSQNHVSAQNIKIRDFLLYIYC